MHSINAKIMLALRRLAYSDQGTAIYKHVLCNIVMLWYMVGMMHYPILYSSWLPVWDVKTKVDVAHMNCRSWTDLTHFANIAQDSELNFDSLVNFYIGGSLDRPMRKTMHNGFFLSQDRKYMWFGIYLIVMGRVHL